MPSVLHLLKPDSAPHALTTIERQSREPETHLTVVLLHGITPPPLPEGVTVYRLADNNSEGSVSHSDLLDLIFSADQVIPW